MPLARTRGELLAHGHHTNSPSNRPAIGTKIADTTNREGGAERVAEPAVPKSIAGARALITYDEERWRDVARTSVQTAQPHDAPTRYLRHTVPGIGKLLRLVRRYDIQQLARFPRGQDVASYGRLGKCAKAAAGKRCGPAGTQLGHAPLQWAFSEAAVLCLRANPAGPKFLPRVEQKPIVPVI